MNLLIAALLTGVFPLDDLAFAGEMNEACRFEGEWYLSMTRDERRIEAGSEKVRMSVSRDGEVRFTFENVITNQGAYRIYPKGRTERLDLRTSEGRVFEGQYDLKGDTLSLCFSESGKGRPDGLTPRGTQWLEVWKRLPR